MAVVAPVVGSTFAAVLLMFILKRAQFVTVDATGREQCGGSQDGDMEL